MVVKRTQGGDGRRRLNNHNVRRMSGRSYKGGKKRIYGSSFLPLFVFLALGLLFLKASKKSWKLIS
jgi:hypothetical protein